MMTLLRRPLGSAAAFAGAAVCLVLAAGCGGGQQKAQVSGTVTLDGVPIENGTIQFYPTGAGQTAGGGIEQGKYKLDASVGEMTVTISATKVVGKQKAYDTPDSPVRDKVAEMVPDEYNKMSKLKVTLKPGVNENVNFDLVSKPNKK